jgi:hypothetical protein
MRYPMDGDSSPRRWVLNGMIARSIFVGVALSWAMTGCGDPITPIPIGPVPSAGEQFVLESIGGSPPPIERGPESRVLADTVAVLAPSWNERLLEHRVAYELSGERQHAVYQEAWHVKGNDVMEWRCPINALCSFSVKEARVRAGRLEISYPDSDHPTEVYRRLPP